MLVLDGAVFVRLARVVACRGQFVVGAQRLAAVGLVLGGVAVEVTESRRRAVEAMFRLETSLSTIVARALAAPCPVALAVSESEMLSL